MFYGFFLFFHLRYCRNKCLFKRQRERYFKKLLSNLFVVISTHLNRKQKTSSFSFFGNVNISFICAYSRSEPLVSQRLHLKWRVPLVRPLVEQSQLNKMVICWAEFLCSCLNVIASFEKLTWGRFEMRELLGPAQII